MTAAEVGTAAETTPAAETATPEEEPALRARASIAD